MPAEDSCFFFFQAEDGIRDFHVTGVQTCALPIFASSQKDSPVNRVEAERCSPGSTCAPPFGISVFSIGFEAGTPRIHLAFSLRMKMPWWPGAAVGRCTRGAVQRERLRSRGDRRPFRPPWRKRFSLGRGSLGGRSFRFFTPLESRRSQRESLSNLPELGFRSREWSFFAMNERARRFPYQE